MGFQYPTEVSGVGFSHFLRTSYNALSKALKDNDREVFITVREFQKYLKQNINDVGLADEFLSRYLNEGFSGGEKKRSEVCLLYTSPSPRDRTRSRMPSSA